MKLSHVDRAALQLPPPGYEDAVVEEGGEVCLDCGDKLTSAVERHLFTCDPCRLRRRNRWEAARQARRAAGGRD